MTSAAASFGPIIDALLADAHVLLHMPDVLKALGLPLMRVYVLNGAALDTGKSRLITAFAKYLDLPLYSWSEVAIGEKTPSMIKVAYDVMPGFKFGVGDVKALTAPCIGIMTTAREWTDAELKAYGFVDYARFFTCTPDTLADATRFYKSVFTGDTRYDQ
jgi:hypothetical protein